VDLQIQHMINTKYKNIHYNAPNIANELNNLIKRSKNSKNPFDHTVVIIEEAHNFVSRIVNNLKSNRKDTTNLRLYNYLMDATDCRIVMLSGTPIINYPNEMAVTFNILRGYINTWTFPIEVTTAEKVNTGYFMNLFAKNKINTHDFVEYSQNNLTITRNPFGFINVYGKGRQDIDTYQGVKLDATGNISNEDFIANVRKLLDNKNGLKIKGNLKLVQEKCLNDDPVAFREKFVRTTAPANESTTPDIMHVTTLQKRILGLTSFFRVQNDDLLPKIITSAGNTFHEIKVPMSDYQFETYAKIRKDEMDKEKNQKKRKQMNADDVFIVASSYRIFSRTCCNYAFTNPPGRPQPIYKKQQEESMMDGIVSEKEELGKKGKEKGKEEEEEEEEEDEDEEVDESAQQAYLKKISTTIEYLRNNKIEMFSKEGLMKSSPKFWEILKRIKDEKNKGLHLLYSNFLTLEGIGIFKLVLETNGYREFRIEKNNNKWELVGFEEGNGKPRFVSYTGNESEEQKEMIRNIYNGDWDNIPFDLAQKFRKIAKNNMYGEIIQVFMITAAGAEGINLKNTRFVHIMEPYWHNVRLEQVVGRARRLGSHLDLPVELRTVQVFLYLSVMSESQKKNDQFKEIRNHDVSKLTKLPVTTDESLYEIASRKQEINAQFLTVIKETAMDCRFHIVGHNKNSTQKLKCAGYDKGTYDQTQFASDPRFTKDE
jgi:hypothetical protein